MDAENGIKPALVDLFNREAKSGESGKGWIIGTLL